MDNSSKINNIYQSKPLEIPSLDENITRSDPIYQYSPIHDKEEWSIDEINNAFNKNTITTWSTTNKGLTSNLRIKYAEGCYLYGYDGKKYLDFSSQAMFSNLGHTIPQPILDGIFKQLNTFPCNYGGIILSEPRARMCNFMSEIINNNILSETNKITGFVFPSGGGEANEVAIRIARSYTGKFKIMSRYRSYHGGTMGSLSLTGDHRSSQIYNQTNGFIKFFDPNPFYFNWINNNNNEINEEEISKQALKVLHEQILFENPNTIAAIFLEGITGTNGWVKPPKGYIEGIKSLCNKYNILLVIDEVMAGFGRTGKLFSYQHYNNVVPDIVTFAKGISSGYLPLSGVGMNIKIHEYFKDNVLPWGATYQSHNTSLIAGYECIKYLINNNLIQYAESMENIIKKYMNEMIQNVKSDCIYQCRVIGMAGCIDIKDPNTGEIICDYNQTDERMLKLRQLLYKHNVSTMMRGPLVHVVPPLIATEEDIKFGFEGITNALNELFG